ncbi:hypothetical protein GOBAR_AA18118 [Gossypium barbadense]|uniref:Uncharacterized protein n=1 Tax=Gossypium barbadense TaxID=3634 RepID=A0A2P5XGS5_GOSBA|nr:hypothetical protein GOBAR_AA18118 [Gossypium barbadense]
MVVLDGGGVRRRCVADDGDSGAGTIVWHGMSGKRGKKKGMCREGRIREKLLMRMEEKGGEMVDFWVMVRA